MMLWPWTKKKKKLPAKFLIAGFGWWDKSIDKGAFLAFPLSSPPKIIFANELADFDFNALAKEHGFPLGVRYNISLEPLWSYEFYQFSSDSDVLDRSVPWMKPLRIAELS